MSFKILSAGSPADLQAQLADRTGVTGGELEEATRAYLDQVLGLLDTQTLVKASGQIVGGSADITIAVRPVR
jgi:hypothetical protein